MGRQGRFASFYEAYSGEIDNHSFLNGRHCIALNRNYSSKWKSDEQILHLCLRSSKKFTNIWYSNNYRHILKKRFRCTSQERKLSLNQFHAYQ